jgi:uncharacterized protein (UPF0264 family)
VSSTRLLVSVRDVAEAELAAATGPCLVDAKDPENGALGSLRRETIRAIVDTVAGRASTSAVAGEPASWSDLVERVIEIAGTGVGMVKVAWPEADDAPPSRVEGVLRALRCPVVAVFFAERRPDRAQVARAAQAGFSGAMIDTARKDGRTLRDHLSTGDLEAFVRACRALDLMSGLAGSLRLADIPDLASLGPTYLGFRGGLCGHADRRASLERGLIVEALSRLEASVHDAAVA